MIRYALLAGTAIVYLLVMSNQEILRQQPDSGHSHLPNSANGLLSSITTPVLNVEIEQSGSTWLFVKKNAQWFYGTSILSDAELKVFKDFLAMLRNSEPVRTFLPEDLLNSSQRDYGLETPELEISVSPSEDLERDTDQTRDRQRTVVKFGHATPDGSLRYAGKTGDPNLYVMSGFVFQQAIKFLEMLETRQLEK